MSEARRNRWGCVSLEWCSEGLGLEIVGVGSLMATERQSNKDPETRWTILGARDGPGLRRPATSRGKALVA